MANLQRRVGSKIPKKVKYWSAGLLVTVIFVALVVQVGKLTPRPATLNTRYLRPSQVDALLLRQRDRLSGLAQRVLTHTLHEHTNPGGKSAFSAQENRALNASDISKQAASDVRQSDAKDLFSVTSKRSEIAEQQALNDSERSGATVNVLLSDGKDEESDARHLKPETQQLHSTGHRKSQDVTRESLPGSNAQERVVDRPSSGRSRSTREHNASASAASGMHVNEALEEGYSLVSYIPPRDLGLAPGKHIRVPSNLFQNMTSSAPTSYVPLDLDLTEENLHWLRREMVFVTAANSDYRYDKKVQEAIATVHQHFPRHKIIFYDVGVTNETVHDRIRSLCNVEYRSFDFSRYPKHVRFLKDYAFKGIILQEVLAQYKVVMWMDSSIRFVSNSTADVFRQALAGKGVLSFSSTGHSIFEATAPSTYTYFPMNVSASRNFTMKTAAGAIYLRTNPVYNRVALFLAFCCLDADCLSASSPRKCSFRHETGRYAQCHRFDQSLLNILTSFLHDTRKPEPNFQGPNNPVKVIRKANLPVPDPKICV